jgi:hypothetical protein
VSRQETYESLCVLLEEYADADVETVAEQIIAMLGLLGEDALEALDPPPGLQHWLLSHGLSLVATVEARAPAIWEAVQSQEEPEENLEEEPGKPPLLQIGDYVEFRTAPSGPHSQSKIGSGTIMNIAHDTIEVEYSPGGAGIIIFPDIDFIRLVSSGTPPPQPALPRTAQAPPS